MKFFSNLFKGLKKTRNAINQKINSLLLSSDEQDFYEELEYILISSDISTATSSKIIDKLKNKIKYNKVKDIEEIKKQLRVILKQILTEIEIPKISYPASFLIVGVNGSGKTTSLGKLSNYFKHQNKKTLIAAADTFRAAAIEQVEQWAEKTNTRIIKNKKGSDPSSVVYDAITSAKSNKNDVLLIDTAGRLHNKKGLMEELKKINRTIDKNWSNVFKQKLLVIDATVGQNALSQVEYFNNAIGLDGIILTKLDGTAKGGIVVSIIDQYEIPVRYVGTGEGVEHLEPFDAKKFVDSII